MRTVYDSVPPAEPAWMLTSLWSTAGRGSSGIPRIVSSWMAATALPTKRTRRTSTVSLTAFPNKAPCSSHKCNAPHELYICITPRIDPGRASCLESITLIGIVAFHRHAYQPSQSNETSSPTGASRTPTPSGCLRAECCHSNGAGPRHHEPQCLWCFGS